MKLKKKTALLLSALFILANVLASPAVAVSGEQRSAMTNVDRQTVVREALARVEAAAEASKEIMKEWAESGSNTRVLPTGCAMATKTISGPEHYTTDWADSEMVYLYMPETATYLGALGGNFVKTFILFDDKVRANANGLTIYGKESFVSSGGVMLWSGGPYATPVVYTEYLAAKNNSATFKGAVWWGDWQNW